MITFLEKNACQGQNPYILSIPTETFQPTRLKSYRKDKIGNNHYDSSFSLV